MIISNAKSVAYYSISSIFKLKPMTSSEDFKQAIKAGNINEAFLVAMSNAPELNITTKVITADGHSTDVSPQIDNYLHTHINLIEGKVENEIGEKLTGDRYSEIKQFHLQQVTKGHQTIQQNLLSLQRMFQLMSSFQQHASSHAWVDIAADVANLPTKPDGDRLYGKVPNALEAGTSPKTEVAGTKVDSSTEKTEPQLPFEAEEMMEDLLSLADIDDEEELEEGELADWSQWLDDEPDVDKVFDIKDAAGNRQNPEAEQNGDPQSSED